MLPYADVRVEPSRRFDRADDIFHRRRAQILAEVERVQLVVQVYGVVNAVVALDLVERLHVQALSLQPGKGEIEFDEVKAVLAQLGMLSDIGEFYQGGYS